GLDGDARQQLIVGFARHREDGDLLAFDQAVEDVDHGHVSVDHFRWDGARHRIDGGPADVDLAIARQVGTPIDRLAVTAEHAAEDVRGVGYLGRVPEETHRGLRGKPFAAAKDLQRHVLSFELDHLCQGLFAIADLDDGHVAQANVAGAHLQNVADNGCGAGITEQITQSGQHTITSFGSVRLGLYSSGYGCACQMSLAYSVIVRSLENLPAWPTLRIALRAHASGCVYRELTLAWVAT